MGDRPNLVLAQVHVFCPGQGPGQDLNGTGPGMDLGPGLGPGPELDNIQSIPPILILVSGVILEGFSSECI